jgi:hypothetical protein
MPVLRLEKEFPPSLWQNSKLCKGQTVEQKWFAGAHTNIGGGYSDTGLYFLVYIFILVVCVHCIYISYILFTKNAHLTD